VEEAEGILYCRDGSWRVVGVVLGVVWYGQVTVGLGVCRYVCR
jgi:hypothetical protein